MKRVTFSCVSIFWLLFLVSPGNDANSAEKFPTKPISFIVAAEPGSDLDVLSRPFATKLSSVLGQPVIIVNKPGGGTSIGTRVIRDAKPDGYTIGWGGTPLMINKLMGILPYDYHEFTLFGTYYVFYSHVFTSVRGQKPFKTIQEVISYAKLHPGEIRVATASIGQVTWLGAMSFQESVGVKLNIIPQPGAGGFIAAQIAGGHVDLGVTGLNAIKPQLDAGNVRILALLQPDRLPEYDVPTMRELGFNVIAPSIGYMMGPPKMPKDVTYQLVKAVQIAANDPEYHKFLRERFNAPLYHPPDTILRYLDEQKEKVRVIMEKAGILKDK